MLYHIKVLVFLVVLMKDIVLNEWFTLTLMVICILIHLILIYAKDIKNVSFVKDLD